MAFEDAVAGISCRDGGGGMAELGEHFGRERADGGELGLAEGVAEHGDQRAGDGGAGDGGPIDVAGGEGFEHFGVRRRRRRGFRRRRLA